MRDLWLASGSPRRAQLLHQIGVPFQRLPAPGIDERVLKGEAPEDYVCRMAREKAMVGWQSLAADRRGSSAVLGADTSVVADGKVLGKPDDADHAAAMLNALNGHEHQVMSAVSLVWEARQETRLSVTRVCFRRLDADAIDRYVETGEGTDKAGGYAIQGLGALLVDRIDGSYSGVVGLPLEVLPDLFKLADVAFWRSPDHSA